MITTHVHASKGPTLSESSEFIELWLLPPCSCWGKQKLASGRHVGICPPSDHKTHRKTCLREDAGILRKCWVSVCNWRKGQMKFTWLLVFFVGGLSSSPLQEEDYSNRYWYAEEPKDDEDCNDLCSKEQWVNHVKMTSVETKCEF